MTGRRLLSTSIHSSSDLACQGFRPLTNFFLAPSRGGGGAGAFRPKTTSSHSRTHISTVRFTPSKALHCLRCLVMENGGNVIAEEVGKAPRLIFVCPEGFGSAVGGGWEGGAAGRGRAGELGEDGLLVQVRLLLPVFPRPRLTAVQGARLLRVLSML